MLVELERKFGAAGVPAAFRKGNAIKVLGANAGMPDNESFFGNGKMM